MAEKKEKKFNITDNEAIATLNIYCQGKGYGKIIDYEKEGYVVAKFRYGKAKIEAYYLYVDKGAITDVVFDLSDVHKKYYKKKGSLQDLLRAVLSRMTTYYFYIDKWDTKVEGQKVSAIGSAIAGFIPFGFNKYCVWAPSLKGITEALDKTLGLSYSNVTKEDVDSAILKTYKQTYVLFDVIAATGLALGLVLVILGIVGVINKVLGWVLGVILLVAGGICLAAFILGYKEIIKEYCENADEKFYTADHSQFTRM